MSTTNDLSGRIKAEFEARAARKQEAQQEREKQSQAREQGLQQFSKACEELASIWRPKLEEFAKQFGDKIKVTPTVNPEHRQAKVVFMTDLASMSLTLSAAPSSDASGIVLDYDLLLVPICFEYERHSRLEMPLSKIDRAAVGKWIDDRLISCVKVYLEMLDNEFYIKRAMVEDPITKAKFHRDDAKGKLEHGGKTYYFTSEETRRQFEEKLKPAPAAGQKTAVEPKGEKSAAVKS